MSEQKNEITNEDFRIWKESPVTQILYGELSGLIVMADETEYSGDTCDSVAIQAMEKQGFKAACNEVLEWIPQGLHDEN